MDKSNNLLMSGSHDNTGDIHICGACRAQFNDVVIFLSHKKQCSGMGIAPQPHVSQIRKSNTFDINSDQGPSPCENVPLESLVLARGDTQSPEVSNVEGVYRQGEGEMLPLVLSQDTRNQSTVFNQPVSKMSRVVDLGRLHQDQIMASITQSTPEFLKQQRSQHRLSRIAQSDGFREEDNLPQGEETLSVERNIQNVTTRFSQGIVGKNLCQPESRIAQQSYQLATSKFAQDRVSGVVPLKETTHVHNIQINSPQVISRLSDDDTTGLMRNELQLSQVGTSEGQTILLRSGAQLSQITSSGQNFFLGDGSHLSQIASSEGQNVLIRDETQISHIQSSEGHTILLRDGVPLTQIASSEGQNVLLRVGEQLSQIPISEGQTVLLRDGAQLSQIQTSEQAILLRDGSQHSQIQSSKRQTVLLHDRSELSQIPNSSGQTVVLRDGNQFSQISNSAGQTVVLRDGNQLSQISNSAEQTLVLRDGNQLSQIPNSAEQTVVLRNREQLSQIPTSEGQTVLMRGGVQLSHTVNQDGQTVLIKDGVPFSQILSSDGCTVLIKDGTQQPQIGSSDLGWQHQQQVMDSSQRRVSVDGINAYNNTTEMFAGSDTGMNFEVQIPSDSKSESSNFSNTNVMFHPQEAMMEQIQVNNLSNTTISDQALSTTGDLLSQNKEQNVLHQKMSTNNTSFSGLATVGPVRVSLQKPVVGRQKRIKMNDLGMTTMLKQDSSLTTGTGVYNTSSPIVYEASASLYDAATSNLHTIPPASVYDVPSTVVQDVTASAGVVSVPAGVHGASFQQVGVNDGIPVIQDMQTQAGSPKRRLDNVLIVHDPDSPSKKRYKCAVTDCSFTTTYIRDLERHNRVHTGERPFMCPLCPKSFSRSDKLNIHLRGHTGAKPFKCTFCDYGAADSSSLKKHIRIHTDERPFRCQICPYASRNSSQLIVHLRTHTGDSPFQCSMCDAKFKINSDLKRHMRIHTGEKPYSCDLCDYRCSVRGNLKCHYRINHSSESQKCCPEQDCNFITSSRKTLWEHKKTHDLLRPIKCEFCVYACASQSAMRMHMRVHSTDRPFSCSYCMYSSKQSGNLKTHVRKKHPETLQIRSGRSSKRKGKGQWGTDEDPGIPKLRQNCRKAYKCNICSASFVREDSLRSHTRQHCREIEQNLESTALAVLEQQSVGQHSASLIPQQNQDTTAPSSVSQQICPALESIDTLNQNLRNANSDPFVFIPQQKPGEKIINSNITSNPNSFVFIPPQKPGEKIINTNINTNSDSFVFIPPQKPGDKSIKFMPVSVPLQSENISQQITFTSPSNVMLGKDARLTYRVSEDGGQAIDERMVNVSRLQSSLSVVSRSTPHETVLASAMQSPVMSHSLVSQAQLSTSPKQNHPYLVAAMQNVEEVSIRLPMITQAIPNSMTQHITFQPDSSPSNQISESVYLTQNKYQTIPPESVTSDPPPTLSTQIQIPTSSHHMIKKPVCIVHQAPPESTKLVFADGSPATDSGVVTHQLVQTSMGQWIIQNIPLQTLRLVGKGVSGQMDEEVGSEKVSSSLLPTVMTTLQSDQQMIHPQLVQQVHTGHSQVGHLETVNLQVIKPSAPPTSYPVSMITQEVTEQTAISQNAPGITQFQIVLPSGLQNPQIVRNAVSGQTQIVVQVEEATSSRVEQSAGSGTQTGVITLPISMAQTLLAQVQPQDSGVVGQSPVSVIQDGVQLQEVIVAVDSSSLIGSTMARGTEECHSEAK